MNKYNFEMEKLFDEWKTREHHNGKIFNKDGIVCPELWNEGDKTLFFCKEAYHGESYPEKEYDLARALFEQQPWGMWHRVAEWVYAIKNTTINNVAEYRKLEIIEKHNLIKEIAIVNIKKSDGKSESDNNRGNCIIDFLFLRKKEHARITP